MDTSFPLKYACDMLPRMRQVCDKTSDPSHIEDRCGKAFPVTVTRSRWLRAKKVFIGVPEEVLLRVERAGRTPEGEWMHLQRWYDAANKTQKKRKTR